MPRWLLCALAKADFEQSQQRQMLPIALDRNERICVEPAARTAPCQLVSSPVGKRILIGSQVLPLRGSAVALLRRQLAGRPSPERFLLITQPAQRQRLYVN